MSEQNTDNNNNNRPNYEANILEIASALHTLEINKHRPERERLFQVHQNERNQIISDILSRNAPDSERAEINILSEEAQRRLQAVQTLVREQAFGNQEALRRRNTSTKKKKKNRNQEHRK